MEYFRIVWNHPTKACEHRHQVYFQETLRNAGIVFNEFTNFNGEKLVLFYRDNFGLWPHYDHGNPPPIHGGLPQLGNVSAHLRKAEADIERKIPDPNFDGLTIIDMEEWRPLFERNWTWKDIYRSESRKLARDQNRNKSATSIENEAVEQFEQSAREYMVESLKLGRRLRPKAKWGYYHFPYCYNNRYPKTLHCTQQIKDGNDRMSWLWENGTGIYPSIYLFHEEWDDRNTALFIYSILSEGLRTAAGKPIYTYMKTLYLYDPDRPLKFLSEIRMKMSLRISADFGIDGVILWGGSATLRSFENCALHLRFLRTIITPYSQKLLTFTKRCATQICSGRGRCVHRGAVDETYAEEVLRDTQNKLNDFSSTDHYLCRWENGSVSPGLNNNPEHGGSGPVSLDAENISDNEGSVGSVSTEVIDSYVHEGSTPPRSGSAPLRVDVASSGSDDHHEPERDDPSRQDSSIQREDSLSVDHNDTVSVDRSL